MEKRSFFIQVCASKRNDRKMKDKTKRKKRSKIKRRNAKLYPIYKMFAWDLLFFYSVEFLFMSITKKIDVSTILMINGLYLVFKVIMQVPAVAITDAIGRKKSIVLGNILVVIYLLILIIVPGAIRSNRCKFYLCIRILYKNTCRI